LKPLIPTEIESINTFKDAFRKDIANILLPRLKVANRIANGFESNLGGVENIGQEHILISNEYQFRISIPYYLSDFSQSNTYLYQLHDA
ncbi:36389_t:CDS:2, partial [Gigaspora margarita]